MIRSRTQRWFRASALLSIVLGAGLQGCDTGKEAKTRSFSGPSMGTRYSVTVTGLRNDGDAQRVQACIDGTLEDVDRTLSTYRTDSEVSRFNRAARTDWIPVSTTLLAVLAAAQRVSVESRGAFDVTIAPLVRLWGFGAGSASSPQAAPMQRPAPEFIHDAMAGVGYAWLEVRTGAHPAARKGRLPLELDLDGIAPGYAVDRISRCLSRARLVDHLVEVGGEVRTAGRRADGRPWQVAIEAPRPRVREAYAGVQLTDLSISTSGNYRDFRRTADGRVISHTIDPRHGEPVRHALASVTVVHPRAILADAYATALMVLGPEEGFVLAERLGLPALFIERVGQSEALRERATPAFDRLRP